MNRDVATIPCPVKGRVQVSSGTDVLIGVDVGTTNCKVGVHSPGGALLAMRRRPTPRDPTELVEGVLGDLWRCLGGRRPLAVGITGVAEGGVPLDGDLRPAGPLVWWHDRRAEDAARRLADEVGRPELFDRTGVDISAKTPLALWRWYRDNGGLPRHLRSFVGVPELIATALCGEPFTDPTLAGRSGAFDQRACRFDEDLLALAGIRAARLPEPRGAGTARHVLPTGTPVFVTGHDHLVAAYAAGARRPGDVADSLGTAEAVVTIADAPPPDGLAGTGVSWNRTADGRHWALVSGFPCSGGLVDWLRSVRADDYDTLDRLAGDVRKPTGVVVLPYLGGRAAPRPAPGRGLSVRGLATGDGFAELVVAVLEGASCHARWMAEHQARQTGGTLGAVTVLGRPARARAWLSVKAHVLPGPVRLLRTEDAACAGAAALAGRALGLPAPVADVVTVARDDDLADRYDSAYRDFLSHVGEVA